MFERNNLENGCQVVNRPIALLILVAAIASSLQVQPIRADEPTPAVRVAKAPNMRDGRPVSSSNPRMAAPRRDNNEERLIGAGVKRPQEGAVRRASATGDVLPQPPRSQRPVRRSSVVPASAEVYEDGVVYDSSNQGDYVVEEGAPMAGPGGCSSCGDGGCGGTCGTCGPVSSGWGGCGIDLCNPGFGPGRQLCICLPSHGWAQMEYLGWWQNGMYIPPLLTSRPTVNGVETLVLGDEKILTDRMNGGRIRFGWWFANRPNLGIEGEYLGFSQEEQTETFRAAGAGPFLGRPFFDVNRNGPAAPNRQDIDNGSFSMLATTQFDGGAVRFRRALCCGSGCGLTPFTCNPVPTQSRIDATLGWRYFQLNESLTMNEVNNITGANPRTLNITDRFQTLNQFNGVELGVLWQGRRGYWSLDTMLRTSFGNNRETVRINGSTTITQNAVAQAPLVGGILSQNGTNIGGYTRDRFAVAPEFSATLGYQLTQRWRLTAGYTFIYWSSVVRPGDQIDTDLNPSFFPPRLNPTTGALRPSFAFRESDYWIQGVNLGAEYRW